LSNNLLPIFGFALAHLSSGTLQRIFSAVLTHKILEKSGRSPLMFGRILPTLTTTKTICPTNVKSKNDER